MTGTTDDADLARADIALTLARDLFNAELEAADTIDLKANPPEQPIITRGGGGVNTRRTKRVWAEFALGTSST